MFDRLQGVRLGFAPSQKMGVRFWQLLIILTAVCAFVPLQPEMPKAGLDHSWVLGMNQAVAQGLVFGRDIIFTFGPYASIYTQSFHPATDHLMVGGSLFLGLMYGVGLVLVTRKHGAIPLAGLCLALALVAGLYQSRDALLLGYPLLVSLYCFGLPCEEASSREARRLLAIGVFALFLPFGLLPLIKGSLVALCLAVTTFAVIRFITVGRWDLAILAPFAQALALVVFWLVSGQPLTGLPGYFRSMAQIVSGYTEAMAYPGEPSEMVFYLIAAAVLVVSVLRDSSAPTAKKILLLFFPLSIYFFVVFKAAFVRHDGHALTAGTSILLASAILSFLLLKRSAWFVLLVGLFAWASIDSRYVVLSASALVDDVTSTYFLAGSGLRTRLADPGALRRDFDGALAKIRSADALPRLEGTTDIYSYGQSSLIASGNRWNPRPVLQSYSAYTPALALANRDHISGRAAPDNIVFNVESIDMRLPALDDGPSWPALFGGYRPEDFRAGRLYLKKEVSGTEGVKLEPAGGGVFSLGEEVVVPEGAYPVFIEADIKKNVAGKVVNTLYKVAPLVIALRLENGETRQFRLPSEMAQSGFVVSPLIQSTIEFALLYANGYVQGSRVKSFAIYASGDGWLWDPKYAVRFRNVMISPRAGVLATLHLAAPANASAGAPSQSAEK
ncbi:hypothetical protein [Ralstonia solanacearum]|uniref:hypothetical protein n=1 Tax=Ralstonia solanacearum TaxID=305 RepID=UPI001E3A9CA1|nr:hypothetical protein [Ralstonia solanacearum]